MTGAGRGRTLAVTMLAPMIWGTSYYVAAEFLPPGRPILAGALRALPAGLLLTAIGGRLPGRGWRLRAAVLGVANFAAFFTLLFVAAYRLPGGVAATLGAAQPLVVTLAGIVVLARVPTRASIVAAVAGLGGVALVVIGPSAALDPIGVAAGLGGAASMALGTLLVQRFGRPVSLVSFAGWQLLAGGVLLVPLALVVEGVPDRLSGENVLGFTYLAVAGGIVAYLLWFRGIERLGAPVATFLALLSPVVATIVGFVVQGASLSPVQLLGMGVVFASVLTGTRAAAAPRAVVPSPLAPPPAEDRPLAA
jgi:probable blue pigment (indigoidine) exporter